MDTMVVGVNMVEVCDTHVSALSQSSMSSSHTLQCHHHHHHHCPCPNGCKFLSSLMLFSTLDLNL